MQETALFIGGVGRSGTTLVVDMLGLHSNLSPIYETDFVISFMDCVRSKNLEQLRAALKFCIKWAEPLPHRPHNKREHEKYHHGPHYILFTKQHMAKAINSFLKDLSPSNVVPKINALVNELFQCHAELDGKGIWINKTPGYVLYMPELKQAFPKLKFIHCIRDGRDVACSVVTRPWGPKTHLETANWWKSQVINAQEFSALYPNDFLDIRYEDLVQDPEPTLKKMFEFLEVGDESEAMLKDYREARAGIGLSRSPLGNWKTKFSDEEKEKFWELAGDLLAKLGYSP